VGAVRKILAQTLLTVEMAVGKHTSSQEKERENRQAGIFHD
jgi:hypothetical protein